MLQALAEPIRMMLAYAGVHWEDKRYQVQCVCVSLPIVCVRESVCVYGRALGGQALQGNECVFFFKFFFKKIELPCPGRTSVIMCVCVCVCVLCHKRNLIYPQKRPSSALKETCQCQKRDC